MTRRSSSSLSLLILLEEILYRPPPGVSRSWINAVDLQEWVVSIMISIIILSMRSLIQSTRPLFIHLLDYSTVLWYILPVQWYVQYIGTYNTVCVQYTLEVDSCNLTKSLDPSIKIKVNFSYTYSSYSYIFNPSNNACCIYVYTILEIYAYIWSRKVITTTSSHPSH